VIATFLKDPSVKVYVYELQQSGGIVRLCTKNKDAFDALPNLDALLTWLGVPRGFTVNLLWRDDPRHVDANAMPDKRNVNGGYAVQNSNTITVYRKEEYDRVVIHEVIHALGWDWNIGTTPLPCWNLGENAELTPHLFETWTELYTEYLYCIWYNIPWEAQMQWQRYQAVQILARAPKPWKETTNVFAYYVLKAALAKHIEFLCIVGKPTTKEQQYILCELASSELAKLREEAAKVVLEPMSLRMTTEKMRRVIKNK